MDELTRLARTAAAGDQYALEAFVRQSHGDIHRLCASLVDPESADDLTQETFVRALRSLGSFRGDSSARTWLWAIARNTCTDAIRRRIRHRAALERLPHPEVESVDDEPAAAYAGVLDELDADQRTAFVLTQLLDLSYAEAARVC
ncbi:MAG TPA: sigma-70 family RNA polymerase sigma factor, partial [Acidimicrobiales bacterium]